MSSATCTLAHNATAHYLTAPLASLLTPITLLSLRTALTRALSQNDVTSLHLSPTMRAPLALRVALQDTNLSLTLRWSSWILLLSKGEELRVSVSKELVVVESARSKIRSVVWKKEIADVEASQRVRDSWGFKKDRTQRMAEIEALHRTPTFGSSHTTPSSINSSLPIEEEEKQWDLASPNTEASFNWLSDMLHSFPAPSPPASNASPVLHSRSNSTTSSLSIDAFSMLSLSQSLSTAPSSRSVSPNFFCEIDEDELDQAEAEIFVDSSRKTVVEYECGKVGVLGGAVMLGLPPKRV